jgi:hypothetical protein
MRDPASRVISMFGIFLLAVLAGSGVVTFFAARAVWRLVRALVG